MKSPDAVKTMMGAARKAEQDPGEFNSERALHRTIADNKRAADERRLKKRSAEACSSVIKIAVEGMKAPGADAKSKARFEHIARLAMWLRGGA